jgi:hypothetical protein
MTGKAVMSSLDQTVRELESKLITFLIAVLALATCASLVLLFPAIQTVFRPIVTVLGGR